MVYAGVASAILLFGFAWHDLYASPVHGTCILKMYVLTCCNTFYS